MNGLRILRLGAAVVLSWLFLLILLLAGTGNSNAAPFILFQAFHIPTLVVVLASALTGAAFATSVIIPYRGPPAPGTLRDLGYAPMLSVVCAVAAFLLIAAVGHGDIAGHKAAIAFILAVLALAAGIRCVHLLGKGQSLGFESHWGGLGGGGGGWRILPPTGLAILALSLAAGAIALVTAPAPSDSTDTTKKGIETNRQPATNANQVAARGNAMAASQNAAAPSVTENAAQ
jgi:hypothetical protein